MDVQIGGITRADLALEVGQVTESITVTGATTGLQTDNASLGGVIEGRQVLEAPLNGRNVNNLLDFVPGVVPGGGTSGSTVANGGTGQVSPNTQAISYGNYQIGGAFSGQSRRPCSEPGAKVPSARPRGWRNSGRSYRHRSWRRMPWSERRRTCL